MQEHLHQGSGQLGERPLVHHPQHQQHANGVLGGMALISDPLHDSELQFPPRQLSEGAEGLRDGSETAQIQVCAESRHDQLVRLCEK
jgi:hypothetical protein